MGYSFLREGFSELEGKYTMTFPETQFFKREILLDIIKNYDILIPNFAFDIDQKIIDKGEKLKLIANFGVGYDNIDITYAAEKGIAVTNTPQSVLEPTAELCFGLLIATARKIGFYNNHLRNPEGLRWGLYENLGTAVYGQTLGIIGMGRIGQAVARRAIASGMKIIYHNRHQLDEKIEKLYDACYVDLDTLLQSADFVSLNAPSNAESFHLIGEEELKKMKNTAILINVSRGNLVDEQALIKALKSNTIWGAGLDVFENEPHISPELLTMDNVVVTPHAGTKTIQTKLDMQREIIRNIRGFFEGIYPVSRVV